MNTHTGEADTLPAIGSTVIFTPHHDDKGHGNLKYMGKRMEVIARHNGLAVLLYDVGCGNAFTVTCNDAWYEVIPSAEEALCDIISDVPVADIAAAVLKAGYHL